MPCEPPAAQWRTRCCNLARCPHEKKRPWFVAQMSVASQSISMRSLHVSPLIHEAVAHLQMHHVGFAGGQAISPVPYLCVRTNRPCEKSKSPGPGSTDARDSSATGEARE